MAQKKKSPRKKKPKVKLDGKKVLTLAAAIVFLCGVFLSVSFFFSSPKKAPAGTQPQKTEAVSKPQEKKQKPESKKTDDSKKQVKADKKKQETPKPEAKPAPKKTEQKKAEPKKEEKPAPKAEPKKPVPEKKVPETKKTPEKSSQQKQPQSEPAKPVPPKEKPVAKPEAPKAPETKVPETKAPAPAKASCPFTIPPAKNGATLIFVIDDAGLSTQNLKRYTSLPFPITIAVLPKLSHTRECAQIVRSSGKELILHQPMQAQNLRMNPGEGAIKPDMGLSEIYSQVLENLREISPGVKGINNHEGSLITADEMKIGAVLDAVSDSGVYFLDSRTTKDTMAPQAALERDMGIYHRDVFIDDIISRDEMLRQIYRGIDIANKNGSVIMIGHVDKSAGILPQLLEEMHPWLKEKGYRLATPSTGGKKSF